MIFPPYSDVFSQFVYIFINLFSVVRVDFIDRRRQYTPFLMRVFVCVLCIGD